MRRMFEFKCSSCNKRFEKLVQADCRNVWCKCGSEARKVVSPVRAVLEPFSGHFPSATDRWAKYHEDKAKSTPE